MNQTICQTTCRAGIGPAVVFKDAERDFGASITAMPKRLFDLLYAWQQRATERRHLMELDDRMLGDLGLTRADVHREGTKPFWRP
jgi:uncharacterized protein YjiS (DUF1127 family)